MAAPLRWCDLLPVSDCWTSSLYPSFPWGLRVDYFWWLDLPEPGKRTTVLAAFSKPLSDVLRDLEKRIHFSNYQQKEKNKIFIRLFSTQPGFTWMGKGWREGSWLPLDPRVRVRVRGRGRRTSWPLYVPGWGRGEGKGPNSPRTHGWGWRGGGTALNTLQALFLKFGAQDV